MDMSRTSQPCEGDAGPKKLDPTIVADLRKQFHGFPVPDGVFDPSKQRADVLRRFGLPPKPDAQGQPALRRVWQRGFGRPMKLQPFAFTPKLLAALSRVQYRPVVRSLEMAGTGGTQVETSSNWSGAYITANRDRQFLQVWGMWKVPNNLKLPPALLQGPAGVPYVCSNWIGLDGQRLYLNSSLPQIGTACTLTPGGTTAEAWTQWWARGDTSTAPLPIGLTVSPGDEVLCVLTAWDPQTVVFVMVNLSHPIPVGIAIQGSPPVPQGGAVVHPDIAGATAEWIVERPRVVGQPTICNFPDYGESEFHLCLAVEGDEVDIFSLFGGLPQVLRGERLIRMFQMLPDPPRTQFISVPRKLDDHSVRVRYVE